MAPFESNTKGPSRQLSWYDRPLEWVLRFDWSSSRRGGNSLLGASFLEEILVRVELTFHPVVKVLYHIMYVCMCRVGRDILVWEYVWQVCMYA
jgi:hypothetical protein